MASDEQRTLELAEDLVQKVLPLVYNDDMDGLMSLMLRVCAALVNAETRIADLQARLDTADPEAPDAETLEMFPPDTGKEPEPGGCPADWAWTEPEKPEEPEEEDLSADFVMRTGDDVLRRCLERSASRPRQASYTDRGADRLVPAWRRHAKRP
jgi:hypothetical protein